MGTRNNVHYRLPLRLISSGDWARINLAGRVILPVIGVHADEDGIAFPGMLLISKLSGCKDPRTVRSGINSLIKAGLLYKKKNKRRHNVYHILGNAFWKGKRSYFPIYKKIIKRGYWANLSHSEISVLAVMGVKATIDNPKAKDIKNRGLPIFGMGKIQRKKMIRLSGISESSFDYAIEGLWGKTWINFNKDDYEIYLKPMKDNKDLNNSLLLDTFTPNNALYSNQKVPNNAPCKSQIMSS